MPNHARNQVRRVTMALRHHPRIESAALAGLGYWGEDLVDSVVNKAKELWGEGQQATEEMLAEMRDKVRQFEADWAWFRSSAAREEYYRLGLNSSYDELYGIGAKVAATIKATVDSYQGLKSWMGLGLAPLVLAAGVAAAIAAVAYYFTRRHEIDSEAETKRMELELVRTGQMTPEQYYAGQPQPEPGVIASTAKLTQWIVIGGVVGLVAYPMLKRYLGR